jgi:hypothetical protein
VITPLAPRSIGTADILADFAAMAWRNRVLAVLAVALITGELFLVEAIARRMALTGTLARLWLALANSPVIMLCDYAIGATLLGAERLFVRRWSVVTLPLYLVTVLAATIGLYAGLALLILPGLVLLARLSLAGICAMAQTLGPVAAIRTSWRITSESAGAILAVFVLIRAVELAGRFALSGHFGDPALALGPTLSTLRDLVSAVAQTATVFAGVAIYALLSGARDPAVADVFA